MRKKLLFVLHLLIVLTTAASVGSYFFGETDPLGGFGTRCFRYFTTDSNILACIGSLVYLLFTGKQKPRWAMLLRYAGTVSVTITLLTVIFFLGPTAAAGSKGLQGFLMFFEGNVFVLHFSTPVLSLLAVLLT